MWYCGKAESRSYKETPSTTVTKHLTNKAPLWYMLQTVICLKVIKLWLQSPQLPLLWFKCHMWVGLCGWFFFFTDGKIYAYFWNLECGPSLLKSYHAFFSKRSTIGLPQTGICSARKQFWNHPKKLSLVANINWIKPLKNIFMTEESYCWPTFPRTQ